jgi:hypothetical protein
VCGAPHRGTLGRRTPPPGLSVKINGELVPGRNRMKYLELTTDSQWSFKLHLELLVPRVTATPNALCGLLRNIGRAGVSVRQHYEGVVRSRVLCGALIWAEHFVESRCSLLLLRRLQRTTTIRTVRGYRTVSYASATVLDPPPFELVALALRRVYEHLRTLRSYGWATTLPPEYQSAPDAREAAKRETWERWQYQLAEEDAVRPHRAVRAVLPN